MPTTTPTNPGKLPLWGTVRRAYAVTGANVRDLGTVAMVWGPIAFVVLFAINWVLWPALQPEASRFSMLAATVPLAVASALIGATAAVAWHRHILLGEAVTATQVGRFDGRVWRYAGWALGLSLVGMLPVLLLFGFSSFDFAAMATGGDAGLSEPARTAEDEPIGAFGAMVVTLVLGFASLPAIFPAMRLLPALAAIAVGEGGRVGKVWRTTRGNFWRLLVGSLATALPGIAFAYTGFTYEARFASTLWSAINEVVWLVSGLVFVTFVSLAYRHFFPAGDAGGHTPRGD